MNEPLLLIAQLCFTRRVSIYHFQALKFIYNALLRRNDVPSLTKGAHQRDNVLVYPILFEHQDVVLSVVDVPVPPPRDRLQDTLVVMQRAFEVAAEGRFLEA